MHLVLATRSLLGCDDVASFITAFSGNHRYVVNYLLDEVLNRQSKAVQDFLVQTSLQERLSTPLCDAVRAQGGSQALLDFLEHATLFLVPLDDEWRWYRYHHLFAEALYQRLQQTAPTLVPDLHPRASRWYEQHELFAEAISHALAAPALEEAARLIEQCIWTSIVGSQLQTLYECCRASLPISSKKSPRNYSFWVLARLYMVSYASQRYCLDTPSDNERHLRRRSDEAMKIVAAERLATLVSDRDLQDGQIIPSAMNYEVAPALAAAVAQAATDTKEARLHVDAQLVQRYCRDFIYEGIKVSIPVLNETPSKEMQA